MLETFDSHVKVTDVILVVKEDWLREKYMSRFQKLCAVVHGGEKRQDSVMAGFNRVVPEKDGIVLVHDGVRPLVEKGLISRVIEAAEKEGAAIPGIPFEDTIKQVKEDRVFRTLDRTALVRIQTPQGFSYNILEEALAKAKEDDFYGTDEASLVERLEKEVCVVVGDTRNIKITSPEDIQIAEALVAD